MKSGISFISPINQSIHNTEYSITTAAENECQTVTNKNKKLRSQKKRQAKSVIAKANKIEGILAQ